MQGLFLIEPAVHQDSRGYFMESYRFDFLKNIAPGVEFIQDNESRSARGVLRGLHYQLPPFEQTKLVRVIEGTARDFVVDLRKNSATYRKTFVTELSGTNKRQLLVPAGFAHGFITLSDYALFFYKVDKLYSREYERGILFHDSEFSFDLGINPSEIVMSEKDRLLPLLKNAENPF